MNYQLIFQAAFLAAAIYSTASSLLETICFLTPGNTVKSVSAGMYWLPAIAWALFYLFLKA